MAVITVGDVVRVDITFTVDGSVTDPTIIEFWYRAPNEPIIRFINTDVALVKDSTGKYHLDITTDRSGTWEVEWEGTGTVNATRGTVFEVLPNG